MITARTVLAALLVLSACKTVTPPSARPPQAPVWVHKNLSAGVQCTAEAATPPTLAEVEKTLAAVGVTIRDRKMEHQAVCEACDCPSYSVDYRFLIDAIRVASAEKEGFNAPVEKDADCAQWMRTCSCAFACTPRWAIDLEPVANCKNRVDCTQIQPAPARCVARAGKCTFEAVGVSPY